MTNYFTRGRSSVLYRYNNHPLISVNARQVWAISDILRISGVAA